VRYKLIPAPNPSPILALTNPVDGRKRDERLAGLAQVRRESSCRRRAFHFREAGLSSARNTDRDERVLERGNVQPKIPSAWGDGRFI